MAISGCVGERVSAAAGLRFVSRLRIATADSQRHWKEIYLDALNGIHLDEGARVDVCGVRGCLSGARVHDNSSGACNNNISRTPPPPLTYVLSCAFAAPSQWLPSQPAALVSEVQLRVRAPHCRVRAPRRAHLFHGVLWRPATMAFVRHDSRFFATATAAVRSLQLGVVCSARAVPQKVRLSQPGCVLPRGA